MNQKTTKHNTEKIPTHPLKFLLYLSKPYKKWVIFAIIAVVLAEVFSITIPYIIKKVIDNVNIIEQGATSPEFLFWIILFPIMYLVSMSFWRLSGYMGMQWATGVEVLGYKKLFKYLTKHSNQYFEDRFAGALVNKVARASKSAESIVESFLWTYLSTTLTFVLSVAFAVTVNPLLGLVIFIWVSILVPVNYYLVRYRKRAAVEEVRLQSELRGNTVDIVTNMTAVSQFAHQQTEVKNTYHMAGEYKRSVLKAWMISENILFVNVVLISSFITLITYILYQSWLAGNIGVGDFVLMFTIVGRLVHSLLFIGSSMNRLAQHIGEIQESLDDVIIDHDIVDIDNASKLNATNGKIEFRDLDFEYHTSAAVFEKLNITIDPGQRIGIVGPSGSGKTTFIKLLLRQYDVQGGGIYIDDQNIAEVTQDSLHSSISIVPQEPLLFHRTIRENIMYGSPNATEEEMIEATKQAQAFEFINELQEGFETLVGERGVKLSAGQRQRVAIARAILKDAPILVLDEATSALDSESEVLIQKALHTLMEGKTVLAVAHRLSTLSEMNRILVIKNGEIIEDGSHKELTDQKGLYAKLWDHQAGGFIIDEEE